VLMTTSWPVSFSQRGFDGVLLRRIGSQISLEHSRRAVTFRWCPLAPLQSASAPLSGILRVTFERHSVARDGVGSLFPVTSRVVLRPVHQARDQCCPNSRDRSTRAPSVSWPLIVFGSEAEAPKSESYDKRAPNAVSVIVPTRLLRFGCRRRRVWR
jgi:hypothetical protein